MRQPKRTAISMAVAHIAMLGAGVVHAQETPAPAASNRIVITGQRQALQTAQQIKRDAEEIVDSVVAEEAGKLPDKSITEVLQRMVGVTIDRNKSRGDPEHFSVEGSGISIRGLTWTASNLNGREIFSAAWPGRGLSWGDVPPELTARVDVYKNPSAEQLEGGISGLVDLRTALPFDYKGTKGYITFGSSYAEVSKKFSPSLSGLFTTQWDADSGRWGVLLDLANNRSSFQNETLQLDAYYPRTNLVAGQTVWAPKSASWRTNTGDNTRKGLYAALQWKKNDMQSALTYFVSGTKEQETETGIYSGLENAYKSKIDKAVYDSRGVLQSGTYRYPDVGLGSNKYKEGGLAFNTTRGYNERSSQTGELAWNFKWVIDDRWSVQNDLQWVHSKFDSNNRNLQMGTFVPSMQIDASGTGPVRIGFDEAARTFLANPANYYWNIIMPSQSKGDADMYAWKADGKFKFQDPVLRDLRFGLRTTYRSSTRQDASYVSDPAGEATWKSIAEPWAVKQTSKAGQAPSATDDQPWRQRASFAYLNDSRYKLPTELFNYGNFYRGRVGTLPDIVFPTYDVVRDPATYQKLAQDVRYQQCLDGKDAFGLPKSDCKLSEYAFDTTLLFDQDPTKTSRHNERTNALYGSLRFAFDDWKFPVEGSVGLRVVQTKVLSHGYVVFQPTYSATTPPDLPRFQPVKEGLDVSHSHVDKLPSLNLKFKLTDTLQSRLALAKSIYRPGFDDLRESISLSQNYNRDTNSVTYTGKNTGNVNLKPITSDNYDISLEWNPRDGQALTATAFHKDVKDIIMKTIYTRTYNSVGGNPQTFAITGPDNVAKAKVSGIEIAGLTYLDRLGFLEGVLPAWAKGLGVSANYTYIDGKQKLYRDPVSKYCDAGSAPTNSGLKLYGCDTNGVPFHDLPLPYMAKNAFNFAFMYDQGPLSVRLAYNWHSRILQGIDVNGTRGTDATSADPARNGAQDVGWGLPTWQEAFGQWDAGVSYKFRDNLSLSFSVTNLNDVTVRQTQQQHIGDVGRAWFFPGRSYSVVGRYEF